MILINGLYMWLAFLSGWMENEWAHKLEFFKGLKALSSSWSILKEIIDFLFQRNSTGKCYHTKPLANVFGKETFEKCSLCEEGLNSRTSNTICSHARKQLLLLWILGLSLERPRKNISVIHHRSHDYYNSFLKNKMHSDFTDKI